LPAEFNASVVYDESDTDGELDIYLGAPFANITLPDGPIAFITFTVTDSIDQAETNLAFSTEPGASFASLTGQSILGSAEDGRIVISNTSLIHQIYLPFIGK
jgi:hypothetical protein